MKIKIAVFGAGYVGLVSGVGFANLGHDVICMDSNREKVNKLSQGDPVIYESGLAELLTKNIAAKRIRFTDDASEAIKAADILFLALPTPSLANGKTDTSYLRSVARTIGQHMAAHKIIVNKSTAPVGTLKTLAEIIRKETNYSFDIVSNPEFLKEGTAIHDFLRPDRVIIGSESDYATKQMKALYRPLLISGHPILVMDIASAEFTKYAANCMLATRISLMNQMANLCDALGGNIEWVRKGLAQDARIGPKFLYAGIGYGGSCFPKDVRSLIQTSLEQKVSLSIIEAVNDCNNKQWKVLFDKVITHFDGDIKGKTLALWGLSFKPNTDDVREAPAIPIIKEIITAGAKVKVHDPIATKNAKAKLPNNTKIIFEPDPYSTTEGADALLLITEWSEYCSPDYDRLKAAMKCALIFDGRNILNINEVVSKNFVYYGIGKGTKQMVKEENG